MPIFPNRSPMTYGVPRRPRPIVPREERQTLEEHDAAQAAIELVGLRRKQEDIFNAALSAAEEAPNTESALAYFDKATAEASKIQSPNIRVQNALSVQLEGSLSGLREQVLRRAKAAQEKRTIDQGKLEYEAKLDRNDPLGAAKIAQHLGTIAPEDRAIYDELAANAESESAIRQVRGALADGNFVRARELAEKARGVLRSVEQKEVLVRLEDAVGRADKEGRAQTRVELLTEADKAIGLPTAERFAAIEQIKARYALIAESPEDLRATFNWLDSIAEGKKFEVDPQAEIEANDIIRGLDADSTLQENAEARDKILALSQRLGPRTFDFIKELGTRLDGEKTKAVEYATDDAVGRGLIDKNYAPMFRYDLEMWINAREGEVTPVEIVVHGAGLAVMAPPTARPEAKLPPVELSNILGQLKRGSRRLGLMGELDPIDTRAKAIEVILDIWYDPRLTDENRAQLQAMLDAEYSRVAGEGGLQELPPPEWIPAAPQTTPLVVVTDADYAALAPGTEFQDETGKRYRKP